TTDFIEGFNKVVAEGILAGKPVITSSVCPALEYVADGIVEVPPNDTQAYVGSPFQRSADRIRFPQFHGREPAKPAHAITKKEASRSFGSRRLGSFKRNRAIFFRTRSTRQPPPGTDSDRFRHQNIGRWRSRNEPQDESRDSS